MEKQLVQLLQHEDPNNRLLGCILSKSNGYTNSDTLKHLFENVKWEYSSSRSYASYRLSYSDEADIQYISFYVGIYLFEIDEIKIRVRGRNVSKFEFNIVTVKDDESDDIEYYHSEVITVTKSKCFNRMFDKSKQVFLNLILNDGTML